MQNYRFILALLFWFISGSVSGNEIDPRCHRSTEGKEFWFGFLQGRSSNNGHYIEITVTAREATNFKIYIGKSTVPLYTESVPANGSFPIRFPLILAEPMGSEIIEEKGIRLVADKPVNVYAINWDANSADVSLIYPLESLGNDYFAMCYTPHLSVNGRNSEFLVVASADSTSVTITPTVVTDKLKPANVPFKITLNKGELYQVQSMNTNMPGQGDLTGSHIISDKPVAVYGGSLSTTVPATPGISAWDHLYEQMPPVNTWGREYYAAPLATRQADRYRVMASVNQTKVWIGNQPPVTIDRGAYHEFTLSGNDPSRIFADKPIMVAQYSQSRSTDNVKDGDPFMIILSPVSQTKNDVTFVTYTSNQIKTYYVNIITLTSETANIQLDGAGIGNQFKPFPGNKYSYAQIAIGFGTYRLRNTNSRGGFLAYVYGFGGVESYGYAVGFNLDLVLDLGQGIDFQGDTLSLCQGQSITLDAGPYFDNYLWSTKDTVREIVVTSQGYYYATGSTTDGCVLKDSIYILVSDPKISIGEDKSGCAPFSVQLSGGSGFTSYEWNTGATAQAITADKTGTYSLSVYDKYGCPARDTMNLTVFPVPDVEIDGASLSCGSKTTALNAEITGTSPDVWQMGSFSWTASPPGKYSFITSSVDAGQLEVTDWGKYEVKYELTTVDGCKTSAVFSTAFHQVPTSDFQYTDDPNDKCKGYSREIKYTGNATKDADFYWDYGGSTLTGTPDWDLRRVSIGVFNSNPFVSLYVEENGCKSDTTRKPIGANPDFTMNTAKSRGCDSSTIFFSGDLKVQDDLLFEWDFGDGSPASNLQKPSHFYADTGFYDVRLQITNKLTGCKIGFQVEEMVKIFPTPVAKLSLDAEVCYPDTITAIYTNSIDSSFCYWEFRGARKLGDGNDTIQVFLQDQISAVRLQVDEFGCKSQWLEVPVKRRPVVDFLTDITDGCQPLPVLAQASSTDEYIDFVWLTDSVNTPGSVHQLVIGNPGTYELSVAAYSSLTGCADTLTREGLLVVHPLPVAGFSVDFPVAILGQSNLNFTNESLIADLYQWDFGDGSASEEVNPKHNFTEMGRYQVSLLAETFFGCLDTMFIDIEILPFDVFTPNAFRPDSEIPENRVFMPVSLGVDPEKFHLQVFNRWGMLVFDTDSPDNKWDGKLKNLQKAPMGNYVWKADYTDIQGYRHTVSGQVILVR
jgi:hypothetical protein